MYPADSIQEINGEVYAIFPIGEDSFKAIHLYSNRSSGLTSFYETIIMMGLDPYTSFSNEDMEYILELFNEITYR